MQKSMAKLNIPIKIPKTTKYNQSSPKRAAHDFADFRPIPKQMTHISRAAGSFLAGEN